MKKWPLISVAISTVDSSQSEFMVVSATWIRMRPWDRVGPGMTTMPSVPLESGSALRRYRLGHLSASALGPLSRYYGSISRIATPTLALGKWNLNIDVSMEAVTVDCNSNASYNFPWAKKFNPGSHQK